MRATVDLDDTLLSRAQTLCGQDELDILLDEALNALIQRESAHRLTQFGGSEPNVGTVPRKREINR